MKTQLTKCSVSGVAAAFLMISHLAGASQADETTISIVGQNPGATPFLSQLSLEASDPAAIKSIRFTIAPKAGSVTRALSGSYSNDYLVSRGFEQPPSTAIFLPVYGLYDECKNSVTLTYTFLDGSSKQASTTITTPAFTGDSCGYKTPTVLQARSGSTDLSYDYVMIKGDCSYFEPAILDTDGALRWVGTANVAAGNFTFFDNAVYLGHGPLLTRIELDGAFTLLADYSSLGIVNFHHNIDRGKTGIILDATTQSYIESTLIEVDVSGTVLKRWDMADIISAAMIAGGDDPNQFVYPSPDDWFHLNGCTYNRADDSLIISSRENFLICLDYETSAIKWILGDTTKKWYQFPSLKKFALTLTLASVPPVGQHAPSITYDQNLLMLDNGQDSVFQVPRGVQIGYASPRKYALDLNTSTASEVCDFEMGQSIVCPYCGSAYEDAPLNYLIDYAFEDPVGQSAFAHLLGLDATGETIFSYRYPTTSCGTIYRSIPIHLENTRFPATGPQPLNLSTRGVVSAGDNVLIGGFIITGTDPKTIVLRGLGPSLSSQGLSGVLSDPVLSLYDSGGKLIATNDNWQSDPSHYIVESNGLTPVSLLESATSQTLQPGAYTVILTSKSLTSGIGLVELYDLSPLSNSKLANISTRGYVGTGDAVLISGFIVGDVDSATTIVRALGPSLASAGVSGALADPSLTIYDSNGSAIASNDNWQQDINSPNVRKNNLAPTNPVESALVLKLPAGAYTAIVSGIGGGTGVGLVEVFDLDTNL
jgi:hypothetical protein